VRIDSDSTIPIESNEGPCQWSRHNRDMDESWVSAVAEIEGRQVDKVDDQDELSPKELGADKEHDKSELQEVVENKVASNTSSCIDIVGVGGKQVPDITDLEKEKGDPIEGGDDRVQSEGCRVDTILSPDTLAPMLMAIKRSVETVVHAGDNYEEPGGDS